MDVTIARRLRAARYLFALAQDQGSLSREPAAFACINTIHDALELFLITAADKLGCKISSKTEFIQYLDLINENFPETEGLPFRARLLEINKVRVLSKHNGVRPNEREIPGYIGDARNFLEKATQLVFEENFWNISLVSSLSDGEAKDLLVSSEARLAEDDFAGSLVECRKAIFLEFEKDYDIKSYEEREPQNHLLHGFCQAPYYSRNPKYISENVREPFDFIVRDHSKIDASLVKLGIDTTTWWNIWRLTPEVYLSYHGRRMASEARAQ